LEEANRTALSGIAVHHANNSYDKNLGSALVSNMVLMYLPDGTNVYGLRVG